MGEQNSDDKNELASDRVQIYPQRVAGMTVDEAERDNLRVEARIARAERDLLREKLREARKLLEDHDHPDHCAQNTREVGTDGLGYYPHDCDCGLDNFLKGVPAP